MKIMTNLEEDEIVDGLMAIHMEGYEAIEKVVKQSGNSGRVYLPSSWVGCVVKVVRLTPIKDSIDTNTKNKEDK